MTNYNRSLSLSFVSALGSKAVSFIYQILSLPLLLGLLGAEQFGVLAMLMSLVGWVNLLAGGTSPYITRVVASSKPQTIQSKVIASSRTILLFGSLFYVIFFVGFMCIYNAEIYSYNIVAFVLLGLSLLAVNFSVADSVRQGLQQQYINNVFMMFANIFIVIGIFTLSRFYKNDTHLLLLSVTILYLPLTAIKICNFISLRYKYFGLGSFYLPFKGNVKLYRLVGQFIGANLLAQLSVVIVKTCAIVLLGLTDTSSAGKMEVVFRYLLISGTFFSSIQMALWPLLTEAKKKQDYVWIFKVKLMLGFGFMAYGIANLVVFSFFGQKIFSLWLGDIIIISNREIFLAAAYFLMIALTQSSIILLMGRGKFKLIAKALASEAFLYAAIVMFIYYSQSGLSLSSALIPMIVLRFLVFLIIAKPAYYE